MSEHKLRSMTEEDLELVLDWRNAPEVRRYMYTSHEIGLREHQAWFSASAADPSVTLLIYEHYGKASGFVNITRGRCSTVADWGFYLSPNAQKGSGRSLGKTALGFAFDELFLHKLNGQALDFNKRSIEFHKKLGFLEEGYLRDQYFDGNSYHSVICFGLLDHEWREIEKEHINE